MSSIGCSSDTRDLIGMGCDLVAILDIYFQECNNLTGALVQMKMQRYKTGSDDSLAQSNGLIRQVLTMVNDVQYLIENEVFTITTVKDRGNVQEIIRLGIEAIDSVAWVTPDAFGAEHAQLTAQLAALRV